MRGLIVPTNRSNSSRFILIWLSLFFYSPPALSDDRKLIDQYVAEHAKSRQALLQYSCQCTGRSLSEAILGPTTSPLWEIRAYRDRDRLRVVGKEGEKRFDKLLIKGQLRSYSISGKTLLKSEHPEPFLARFDPCSEMLLAVNIPNTGKNTTLESLIQKAEHVAIRELTDGSGAVIALRFSDELARSTVDITIKPKRNFLITEVYYNIKTSRGVTERITKVVSYKEFANGILFPDVAQWSMVKDGNWLPYYEVRVGNIELKRPHDDRFQQALPENIKVANTIDGTIYVGNSKGEPKGAVKSLPKERSKVGLSPQTGSDYTAETGMESDRPMSRFWKIVIAVVLIFLIAGAAFMVYRRITGTK